MALTPSQWYWQQVVSVTIGGKNFRCSRRTKSHLLSTIKRLKEKRPNARLVVIQGCYNRTVSASAGTHDFDCVLDVRIDGMDWNSATMFLRHQGWAAWWRKPSQGNWGDHIHMISIPPGIATNKPTLTDIVRAFRSRGLEVGAFVPGQVDDYYADALGMAGRHRAGSDPQQAVPNIGATVFRPKGY